MLSFNEPGWLVLLTIVPPLFILRYFWPGRRRSLRFPFRIWEGEGYAPSGTRLGAIVIFLTDLCSWIGVSLLLLALAEPVKTHREETLLSRGIDIMIVLDQSPSMAARDFPPVNRFDTAREMIYRFVEGRSGDAIGLVSFAEEAVLLSPPTENYSWLLKRLNELEIRTLGDKTAIGMGLAVAILHLSDSTASNKMILLLTDGDDNSGEIRPETAATLAVGKRIKIYSIGIGREGESSVELIDPDTGKLTRGLIRTRFDEAMLRSIAEKTNGGYWRAASPGALETVFQAVDSLENVEKRVSLKINRDPLHRSFLLLALSLILTAFFIRKGILGEIS